VTDVKKAVVVHPTVPIQQVFDTERTKFVCRVKVAQGESLLEFKQKGCGLAKLRSKTQPPKATSVHDVVIHNIYTASTEQDKEVFLIYDNHRQPWSSNAKRNRIVMFASTPGLQMLEESQYLHGDGTFHTAARYFAQLYVLHAFFPGRFLNYKKKWSTNF
jgi:hypothetical protein